MTKRSLLLVDGDAKSLRVLEVSLKKAGFNVLAATSGPAALESMRSSLPDLVISDTEMPEMDGYAFCREFKSNPEWANIPFIFLTGQTEIADKIRGLELGVDDYLTKPIYIKEILTRVRILLQKHDRSTFEQKKDTNTRFAGRLNDMGVVDLIQTIEVSRKTGIIHFRADEKRQATMFFKDGKVIDAEAGHLQGEDAVYRLLTWSEGEFEALFRPVRRRAVIEMTSQSLLMEGMRRLDEWGRLQEQLPPLTQKFEVVYDELWDRLAELPDDINHILRLFDTRRTLEEVIDGANIGDLEAVEIISKLYFEGIIVETDASTGLKSGSFPVEALMQEDQAAKQEERMDLAQGSSPSPKVELSRAQASPDPVLRPALPDASTSDEPLASFQRSPALPDASTIDEPLASSQGSPELPDASTIDEPLASFQRSPALPDASTIDEPLASSQGSPELPDASTIDEPLSGLLEQAITEATPVVKSSGGVPRVTAKGLAVGRVALKKRPATEDELCATGKKKPKKVSAKTKPFAILTPKESLDATAALAKKRADSGEAAPASAFAKSGGGLNAAVSGVTEEQPKSKASSKPETSSVVKEEYEAGYDDTGGEEGENGLGEPQPKPAQLDKGTASSGTASSGTASVGPASVGPASVGPASVGPASSAEVYDGDIDDSSSAPVPILWYSLAAVAAGLLVIVAVKGSGKKESPSTVPEATLPTDGTSLAGTLLPADARPAIVAAVPIDAGTAIVVQTIPDAAIVIAVRPPPDASPEATTPTLVSPESQIKFLQAAARKAKQSGDRLEALQLLDEALTIRRSSTSLFLKTEILLDMGDSAAALSAAGEITRIAPKRAQGWRLLGLARYEVEDYVGAHKAFTRYLELAPTAKDASDVRTLLESL